MDWPPHSLYVGVQHFLPCAEFLFNRPQPSTLGVKSSGNFAFHGFGSLDANKTAFDVAASKHLRLADPIGVEMLRAGLSFPLLPRERFPASAAL